LEKFRRLHIKNEMLFANMLANLFGVFFVSVVLFKAEEPISDQIWQNWLPDLIDSLFTPFAFFFVIGTTLIWERPIRAYLDASIQGRPVSGELASRARQRLLNEPFFCIAMDMGMWLMAATIYPLLHWAYGSSPQEVQRAFFNSLSVGLITITIAFFLLEHVLQKRLAPFFFPDGGLYTVPRTIRIRIRTRLSALLLACNLIPMASVVLVMQRAAESRQPPEVVLEQLQSSIYTYALVFITVGIFLSGLVSRNLSIPFREIITTLRDIRNGRFDKRVRVTSNDEIGYTGDVINEMTEGLRERERLRQSLVLAKEVQQNLMPASDPQLPGLDISGTSLYCEETGGDYFDYLYDPGMIEGSIGIVVGDVSDHGIPSALLMTTARAFLRQRASRSGSLEQIVADVNRQISRDVMESGRFMTLFFCHIDPGRRDLRWVNAGHDPAVVYAPGSDLFTELGGGGVVLGLEGRSSYREQSRAIAAGDIIAIGTDGIWEARNQGGEMFGKDRFREVLRAHAESSAGELLKNVIEALEAFRGPASLADDVTLVVVKVLS
jgi:sigma-B regulation protein RsbU (phosphoserine phosphatase)